MQRRNLLIGMGSLAAGGAATIGTGAFTSVQANRTVTIATADDSDAYLAFDQTDATNSSYVGTNSNGSIYIDLDNNSVSGDGLNANATTQINDLFKIRNQGTQAAVVYVNPNSIAPGNQTSDGSGITIDPQASNRPNGDYINTSGLSSGAEDDQISLTGNFNGPKYSSYQTNDSDNNSDGIGGNDGSVGDALEEFVLGSGEAFDFGLYVSTDGSFDSGTSISETMEIIADSTRVPDSYS